jgi:hypothetical protein
MAALLVPVIARAALIDCPPIATTEGAKVVVGEVRPIAQAAAGSSLSPFEERRLVNAIHQQIGQLNAERPAEMNAVICRERWPEGPEAFTLSLSRNLLDQDVLIELWGVTEANLALIHYVVLPVRLRGEQDLPGVYPSAYSLDPQGGVSTVFRNARELKAFSSLALGFRALERARAAALSDTSDKLARSVRLNDARSYFCEAERLLQEAKAASGEFGPDARQWQALIALATDSAAEAARFARADPDYVGALKLLPEELLDSCQPGVS